MSHVIEVKGLTKKFNSLVAVNNISFDVDHGEIFGLLGPNGAGKSTTISILCTILKPTTGTAMVDGYDVCKHPAHVRKSIGIVFQDPSVDDRLTGRENLKIHANLYGVPGNIQKEQIDKVLKLVELDERADDLVRHYSSGMRRRLEIARSLIHNPKVLFLDEPTVGLDPQSRDHIWTYIKKLMGYQDLTIILSTHYLEEADRFCNRVAIIDHGDIVALDTPHRLKDELGGDTIVIRTQDNDRFHDLVKASGLAKCTVIANHEIKITVNNAHTTLPRITELAADHNIHIETISLQQPQLDDVFLHFTGKELRESGQREFYGMAGAMRRQIR
ncbi:MAG TPA: ATP-binding cassette domain-containing protein [Methanocella sp.]|nr:ATP-binding cassette domain-containing protein [Methanocella sp.]